MFDANGWCAWIKDLTTYPEACDDTPVGFQHYVFYFLLPNDGGLCVWNNTTGEPECDEAMYQAWVYHDWWQPVNANFAVGWVPWDGNGGSINLQLDVETNGGQVGGRGYRQYVNDYPPASYYNDPRNRHIRGQRAQITVTVYAPDPPATITLEMLDVDEPAVTEANGFNLPKATDECGVFTDTGDPRLNGNGDNVCFITLGSGMKELSADDVTDLMSCSLYSTPPSLHPGTSCDPAVSMTGKEHLYVDRDDMVVYDFEPDDALETSITFYLAFQCSTYAGDNYEIKAEVLDTSNAECGGSLPNTAVSGTVTVWRRYYVKLDSMAPSGDPQDELFENSPFELPGSAFDAITGVFRGGFVDILRSPLPSEELDYFSPIEDEEDLYTVGDSGQFWVPHEVDPSYAKNAAQEFASDVYVIDAYPFYVVAGVASTDSMEAHCTVFIGAYHDRWLIIHRRQNPDQTYQDFYDDDFLFTACHEMGHVIGHFPDHSDSNDPSPGTEPDADTREKSQMNYGEDFQATWYNAEELNKLRRGRFTEDEVDYVHEYIHAI